MTKVMVILGSVREGRLGGSIAPWVEKTISSIDGTEVDMVDLTEVDLPFYSEPFSPKYKPEGANYSTPQGEAWVKRVDEADAFVIITPEYNHSLPAVLKNALDSAGHEWDNKKVVLVSYSGMAAGGLRALEHLIQISFELGLQPVGKQVILSGINKENAAEVTSRSTDFLKEQVQKLL